MLPLGQSEVQYYRFFRSALLEDIGRKDEGRKQKSNESIQVEKPRYHYLERPSSADTVVVAVFLFLFRTSTTNAAMYVHSL